MKRYLRYGILCLAAAILGFGLSLPAAAQAPDETEYIVRPLPPGGPPPRLANGHPDLTGHWFPNGAGQGVSGRFGVDPAALGTFDREATPESPPVLQEWARERIDAMTPTGARVVEVVGELHAARRAGHMATEPVHDDAGPQARFVGAVV